VTGFFGTSATDLVATWVAAVVTLIVFGALIGERRIFGWTQHLLAGLATGFLGLIVLTEVVGPRLVQPIVADPSGRPELWAGVALVATAAAAPWLPRRISVIPVSIAIGSLAAFALGGAVIGTLLPQIDAAIVRPGGSAAATLGSALALVVTGLVLVAFLHGIPRGRVVAAAAGAGRWLLIGGIGGWLGFLILSRLILLVDRIGFLLGDWLGLVP
jgi:hypothetical protein